MQEIVGYCVEFFQQREANNIWVWREISELRGGEIYKIYSTQICPTIGLIYQTVASVAQQDCLR